MPPAAQNAPPKLRVGLRSVRTVLVLFGCLTGLALGYLAHQSMSLPSALITPQHRAIHLQHLPAASPRPHPAKGRTIHTVFTSDGSPYLNFQSRLLHATFTLAQQAPGGELLTGFTRILHRTSPDVLSPHMPTFLTPPVDPKCDTWCAFPVASRPVSFLAWLNATRNNPDLLRGDWILLLETDFAFMKPIQPPDAAAPRQPGLGFLYTYMFPENYPELMEDLFPGGHVSQIPKTGPAPMLMRPEEWRKVTPLWVAKTQEVDANPVAKKQLGWIREMYAFAIALAMSGVQVHLQGWPDGTLMVHLPSDVDMGKAAMVHYTYGTGFKLGQEEVFRFEKRDYNKLEYVLKVPPMMEVPPYDPRMVMSLFEKGDAVTKRVRDSMAAFMATLNKAIAQLPELSPEGNALPAHS